MKKITIFALHLGFGGIEKSVANLANILCDSYDVEIISTYKLSAEPAFDINKKVKISYLINDKPNKDILKKSIKKLNILSILKELVKAIEILWKRYKYTKKAMRLCKSDIIISTRALFNKWLGKTKNKNAYKIAWEHNHHHGNSRYVKKVINSVSNMDALVLVSASLKKYYSNILRKKDSKCICYFIPNYIDYVPEVQSKLNSKRIVSIGRLAKEKGFLDLIELYSIFNKNHKDWQLDIVGDGYQRESLEKKIKELRLEDNVTLHGFLKKDELEKVLLDSSIYVMTSYTESFGLVLIEAMSYGLPCIAFKSAEGANDIISNGKDGYLIDSRSYKKMIEKISVLVDDYNKRKNFGENAKQKSLNYTADKVKNKWEELLKNVDN